MVAKALVLLAAINVVGATDVTHQANPIRKVVNMLQMMQNKVAEEGRKKQATFDKFMCYCDNADTLLGGAITAAENKIPMLESSIGEDAGSKKQLDADILKDKADKVGAKEAISKATAIRAKGAIAYEKTRGDLQFYIDSLDKAIPAFQHMTMAGLGGFLQTSTVQAVKQLSINMDMRSVDREMLTNFLASKNGAQPASAEIIGILTTMKEEMTTDLTDANNTEIEAVASLEELTAAKLREIDALSASVESKTVRSGELAVRHAELLNDLDDTREDLAETKKFLAGLGVNCANKKKEWAVYQKMQAKESLALADTIKVLNDDDALELFKKTLPGSSASFMQVGSKAKENAKQNALAILAHIKNSPRADFLEIALRGGKQGFGKINKMIDNLIVELKKTQVDDDSKKAYCESELDKADDKKKGLAQGASDLETAIDDETELISTFKTEIEALDDGIRALDKEVAEATENRQNEHEEFLPAYAANAAAVDLLKFAKNRLNKFYNPSQYQAPKRQLTEDERITLNMGGTLAPTEAPGGIAGTGIGLMQAAPPPPPAADLAYKTKGEESTGVIVMIDTLVNDVETEMQESKLEEKNAQVDYEKFMSDARSKRAEDSKSMTDKESALAEASDSLVTNKEALKSTKHEQMGNAEFIGGLHADCDWLLKYYDMRKEARTNEIEAMGKAKDTLNGADYGF